MKNIDGMTCFRAYENEMGEPIERTPLTHPYNYESFVTWRKTGVEPKKIPTVVFSDRLFQWDTKKHDELCNKHWGNRGQYWDKREPEKIEAFLRDYNDDQTIELLMVMQGCNQSSGYPLWIFFYRSGKAEV